MKKIFVSSTFRDMQAERDLVQQYVLPYLRNEAKKYGENIDMLDLRWGVNTSELESEEGSKKIISVCLEEIERSHPYMLIFMGERYGTMMPPEMIQEMVAKKPVSLGIDDYALSITALEVEYGALSEYGSCQNCVVCFREPIEYKISDWNERAVYQSESQEATRKLEALKEKISQEFGNRVIFYTADWDENAGKLVDFITKDGESLEDKLNRVYLELFENDWEEAANLSWEEKEQNSVDAVIEKHMKCFRGRDSFFNVFYEKIVAEKGLLVLQGVVGSGKTSIICNVMQKLMTEEKLVFRFLSGNTPFSSNALQFIKQFVAFLERKLEINNQVDEEERQKYDYEKWKKRQDELCDMVSQQETIYVVIDALDQLEEDIHATKLDFLPNSENIRVVVSCTDVFDLSQVENINYKVTELPLLMGNEIREVIEGLFSAMSKNTYEEYIDSIMWKENADSPLYLNIIAHRLGMMNSDELYFARTEEDIIQKGRSIIDSMPDNMEKAIMVLIKEAEQRVSIQSDILTRIIRLLAISRNGMRVSDIEMIFNSINKEFRYLDFSRFRNYLDMFFVERDNGFIDFSHRTIRQAILNSFDDKKYYHMLIARNMWRLPAGDVFRLEETLYHAYQSDEYMAVANYFSLCNEKWKYASIAMEQMCRLVIMDNYGSWLYDAIDYFRSEYESKHLNWLFLYLSSEWAQRDFGYINELNDYREKMYLYILEDEDASEMNRDNCVENLGKYYADRGDSKAIYYLERSAEQKKKKYRESGLEKDLEEYIEIKYYTGKTLNNRLDYQGAITLFEELLKNEKITKYWQMHILINLAYAYGGLKDYRKALMCSEKAINVMVEEEMNNNFTMTVSTKASYYQDLAMYYFKVEDYEMAETTFQKCEKIYLPLLAMDNSIRVRADYARFLNNYGALYREMQNIDMAVAYKERAVSEYDAVLKKTRDYKVLSGAINTNISLAVQYNEVKEYSKAVVAYKRALELCYEILKENDNRKVHNLLLRICRGLCITYQKINDYQSAMAYGLNWEKEAKALEGGSGIKEDIEECAICYVELSRVFKKLEKIDKALKYRDMAIHEYEELAIMDKLYEEKVQICKEKRRELVEGTTKKEKERCSNPVIECSFKEGGSVYSTQKLDYIWNTEEWPVKKMTLEIIDEEGGIIYNSKSETKYEAGVYQYTIHATAPKEKGKYQARTIWIDVYGHKYEKVFSFVVDSDDKELPKTVEISASFDEEKDYIFSRLSDNVFKFRAEIPHSDKGLLEMRIRVLDDGANKLIYEKRILSNSINTSGSNPMTHSLTWNVLRDMKARFEVAVVDYWGRTTVKEFLKNMVYDKGRINITSTINDKQNISIGDTVKFSCFRTSGDGICKLVIEISEFESGKSVKTLECASKSKAGANPLNYTVTLESKNLMGYYKFRVTAEDINGDKETKEWITKIL